MIHPDDGDDNSNNKWKEGGGGKGKERKFRGRTEGRN